MKTGREVQARLEELQAKLELAELNDNTEEWIHVAGAITALVWVLGRLD